MNARKVYAAVALAAYSALAGLAIALMVARADTRHAAIQLLNLITERTTRP